MSWWLVTPMWKKLLVHNKSSYKVTYHTHVSHLRKGQWGDKNIKSNHWPINQCCQMVISLPDSDNEKGVQNQNSPLLSLSLSLLGFHTLALDWLSYLWGIKSHLLSWPSENNRKLQVQATWVLKTIALDSFFIPYCQGKGLLSLSDSVWSLLICLAYDSPPPFLFLWTLSGSVLSWERYDLEEGSNVQVLMHSLRRWKEPDIRDVSAE